MITVIQQGDFSTLQDKGRWGYQAWGMPIAGAMDSYAYKMANCLIGNLETAAVIEMTGSGAAFRFDEETLVSLCGADMQARVNGKIIANWSSILIPRRGELHFGRAVFGQRAYLAVRGGFDVPWVMGSRSTYTGAKLGGVEGRTLQQGDVLYMGKDILRPAKVQKLAASDIPVYSQQWTLRVVSGPQTHLFQAEAVIRFFTESYLVTAADRVNYQLAGPKLAMLDKVDVISDGVGLGAIEIPACGLPYIVASDHGTTRGFPKIGYIIQVDFPKVAQANIGDTIQFQQVTEAAAIAALEIERTAYARIRKQLG
ncbi:5-oxoprolinase subunit C family protein [Propionispira raffinosivorans]|uniref:5-oxoprolinase subunit C family protein n=1 Tax=Propionispira raffinosivorans TaxID=86959 RepID=UPI000380B0D4|nr:biotin-dependent carboxyltransferase family protein [Propionispira raffinosivorans]